MGNTSPTAPLAIRLAIPEDIAAINGLDSFSTSPTRNIHRDMQKYFGSVDPSTHERTLIFLAEINGIPAGKAELMLPPADATSTTGYVKRVVVHPDYRGHGIARHLMEHIIHYAQTEHRLDAIDLHVWEDNTPAIQLYESLGFQLQHRELYFRLPL
jgi:ribosomal protein S18 acetylase RimI-like enzyme